MLLDKAAVDFTALGTDDVVVITCLKCGDKAHYGNSLEGIRRLYFLSRWRVIAPNINAKMSTNIDGICEKCFTAFVDAVRETNEIRP